MAVRTGRPHPCSGIGRYKCAAKHGRNRAKCERYRRAGRRERNKAALAASIAKGFRNSEAE